MKRLIMASAFCATFCAVAMPTKEALEAARPKVAALAAETVGKIDDGTLKAGAGADKLVALAEKEAGEAEKFLLLNGALRLRMRSGDIAGAKAVVDRLRADIKGLKAEQLNDMMLEETPNFCAAWLSGDGGAVARGDKKWHVAKDCVSREGLTVKSLDELRKCGDRSKVVRLYLRGEKGVTGEDLKGLPNVKELDLSETGLEKLPDSLFRLTGLRRLWLARNPLRDLNGAGGASLVGLKELVYLNLDGCSKLESLDIDSMFNIANGGKLRYLRISGTDIKTGLASLGWEANGCTTLRRLYASGVGKKCSDLIEHVMTGKAHDDAFMNLEDLDVSKTDFKFGSAKDGSDGPVEYATIGRNMKRLSFSGCKKLTKLPRVLKSDIPERDWSKLQVLDISDTPVANDKEEIARIRREIGDGVTIVL